MRYHSDDDPSNDDEGLEAMSSALVAVGDDSNALAMFHALRQYKDGVAIINEPEDEGAKASSSHDRSTLHCLPANALFALG